ncbi:hypothetical protein SAMN02745181_0723 [Rubritalea squalenifaciens DSM 18772]|uniref:HTH-type transcriptional regulator n=1 Tax=Rubritalea squalenifaciens DSM 18772 TaxID=1123071 RepID=A0A1M6DEV2_9BACT|nr:transcriptional regulator [Rubritalea squalenifaciens]SHI71796.1 hypothetical protein SAMN02745181_0723 [Rubritalea squalenifaciens DSM 18772]
MAGSKQQDGLTVVQGSIVEVFSDGARLLGLPKSVGEIYGLLYASKEPQSLDDLVSRLDVSKGTGSQGLKMLRTLGAVKVASGEDSRKTFYEADIELKSLVGGFIREQVRPHLDSAKGKIATLKEEAKEDEFLQVRIDKLETWRKKAALVLPVVQKFLGS